MLVTQIAVLLQRLIDDALQFCRQIGIQPHWSHGRLVQDRFEEHRGRVAAKRQCARSHLVHHRPKGKQVGTRVERLSPRLLRRHVGHRTDGRTGAGQMVSVSVGLSRIAGNSSGFELGQAEIENLSRAPAGHK